MSKKKTHEEFVEELKQVNPNIEVVGEYINAHTKILCRCLIDGYEWEATPHNLLKGSGCPKCTDNIKKTHEQFVEEMNKANPNIKIIGEYVNNKTKILCRCLIDGHEWKATPNNLLRGRGCPLCGSTLKKTHEQFVEELKQVNPNIEVVGEYINNRTKILCRCLIDGYEWDALPADLLRGKGCPLCGGSLKKTHEQFVEELKQVNPNIEVVGVYVSTLTKILCRCLIDGHEWEATPHNLLEGKGCPMCAHNQTSWLQEELFKYFSQKYPSTLYRDKTLIGKELDIVIPELNIAIEPGSWYWHFETQNRLSNDCTKQQLCKEKGYTCITIYDNCDFPDVLWYPALVYDKDIGQNKDMLQQVIQDIEETIKEVQQSANYN